MNQRSIKALTSFLGVLIILSMIPMAFAFQNPVNASITTKSVSSTSFTEVNAAATYTVKVPYKVKVKVAYKKAYKVRTKVRVKKWYRYYGTWKYKYVYTYKYVTKYKTAYKYVYKTKYRTVTRTVKKIQTVYYGTKGSITKNYLVNKYIPKTALTSQIVAYAKNSGTPMLAFGDGSGPTVLIVAGVHGNELPATIAAVKLANYLNGKSIKGTVYLIPFLIPYNTQKSTRYWKGKNPNSVANVAGTPSNTVLKLAKQLNVDAVGDFHSTRYGGYPGKNSVLCTKVPTYKSYSMAYYMSKQTGSSFIYEYKAGVSYPGAVEDVCNLAGIPAVTGEVKSNHGTVASGSVSKSYSQMIAFLKYNGVI